MSRNSQTFSPPRAPKQAKVGNTPTATVHIATDGSIDVNTTNQTYADGPAKVGGVDALYICDGGCDCATVTHAVGEALQGMGVQLQEYQTPKPAAMVAGEIQVTHYATVTVELTLISGVMQLANTAVDILPKVEGDNSKLLYMGKREERLLGLESYADQLQRLVSDSIAKADESTMKGSTSAVTTTVRKLGTNHTKKQIFKKRFSTKPMIARKQRFGTTCVATNDCYTVDDLLNCGWEDWDALHPKKVQSDGICYVGKSNWQMTAGTEYLFEPRASSAYVTTGAIEQQDHDLACETVSKPVQCYDLEKNVRDWLGVSNATYQDTIVADLRVGPDVNRDTVRNLMVLPAVHLRVVNSTKAAVILGKNEVAQLELRRDEVLEPGPQGQGDRELILRRLDELLDQADLAGISQSGREELEDLVKNKAQDVWRLHLGPNDRALVPPMGIELINTDDSLPRPYMRKYTVEELEFWQKEMKALCKAGVIRKTAAKQLLPSNLVAKSHDGKRKQGEFRLVCDMRSRNANTKLHHWPLPRLDNITQHLKGSKYFGSADALKGYFQMMLQESCRHLTAFVTPVGAYEYCCCPMGQVNSAAHYQRCMQGLLGDLIYNGILQYLDDTLLYGKTEDELLSLWEKLFTILLKYNVKLHPSKVVLFSTHVTWGGKDVSEQGVRPSEKRLRTVRELVTPANLGDLMSFVYGAAWFRNHIPYFAECSAPLYDLWNKALAKHKRKTSRAASKIQLDDLEQWGPKEKQAFEDVKKGLLKAITLSAFDPELQTCVFTDASDLYWGLLITQCKPKDHLLPWNDQAGKHRPLAVESGRFRHAQLRWHTVDQEGFVIGEKLGPYTHWINGGKYRTAIFTDHKNLLAFFDHRARPATFTKPNHRRMDRWGLNLLSMRYKIRHINGEYNYVADLASRWGNQYAHEKLKTDAANLQKNMELNNTNRVSKKTLCKGLKGNWDLTNPVISTDMISCKKALRKPYPTTTCEFTSPDRDVDPDLLLPKKREWANIESIRKAQSQYSSTRPNHLVSNNQKIWTTAKGAYWIPIEATELQTAFYATAHQAASGHRGAKATLNLLEGRVWWPTMRKDVEKWRGHCVQCLKLQDGTVVPRPKGVQLVPERVGEVISADYIFIGTSGSDFQYILMISDKLSRVVELIPRISNHNSSDGWNCNMGQSVWTARVVNNRWWSALCKYRYGRNDTKTGH